MRTVLAVLFTLPLIACKVGGDNNDDGGTGADANPNDPDANTDPTTCMDIPGGTAGMIHIATTTFDMGCTAAEAPCDADQQPKHTVTVCAYEIDRTEVSQMAYQACIDAGSCTLPFTGFDPASDSPVRWATWIMADAYCRFAGKRLPTEAEWELAARGEQGFKFPWGAAPLDCTLANAANCQDILEPVDSYPQGASPFGLLHMMGNVSEWVNDWYGPYSSQTIVDPQGPSSGAFHVQRGGSFSYPGATVLSNTFRDFKEPDDERDNAGFRCAK